MIRARKPNAIGCVNPLSTNAWGARWHVSVPSPYLAMDGATFVKAK